MLKFIIPSIFTLVIFYYYIGDLLFIYKGLTSTREDMDSYSKRYSGEGRDVSERQKSYSSIVPNFYNLVTDFYQYGWGNSFHFAPAFEGEGFHQSLSRHEHYLSAKLGLNKGDKVLDVGCGVGGPMLEIARFSGAHVTCMNIVEYQLQKAQERSERAKLTGQTAFIHGDFMNMPVKNESFDAVYGIEATCHAPDKVKLWKEIFRVLKPGGRFGVYEWLMTDKYDPENPEHVAVKEGIEVGNALPDIPFTRTIRAELEEAGFVVQVEEDRALVTEQEPIPWWQPLGAFWSFKRAMNSRLARKLTNYLTWVLEKVRIAESGAYYTAVLLDTTAKDLVKGGETGIFTPAYFVIAHKPEK